MGTEGSGFVRIAYPEGLGDEGNPNAKHSFTADPRRSSVGAFCQKKA